MKESVILRISVVVAVTGVFLIYIMSRSVDIPGFEGRLSGLEEGSYVKMVGEVVSVDEKDKITIIRVRYDSYVDVTLFEKDTGFIVGDNVTVYGTVESYKGKEQLTADRMVLG